MENDDKTPEHGHQIEGRSLYVIIMHALVSAIVVWPMNGQNTEVIS